MDLSKLSTGDKVLVGSGIVLFISSFLEWFKFELNVFGVSNKYTETAWDYFFTGIVPVILGLVLIAFVVVTKLMDNVELPEMPIEPPLLILGIAGLAALLVIIRLLIGGDDDGTDALDRSYGLFIATVAVIGLAAGAFMKFKEEGGELPTKKGGGAPGDSGTPPAPF